MGRDLQQLADEIKAMSAPDRLRLAAELIERKSLKLAAKIAGTVVDEINTLYAADRLRQAFGEGARMVGPNDKGGG